MRTGIIARKMGMTRLFVEGGTHVPVTVLALDSVEVVAQRTVERDGYNAVQVGFGKAKVKRVSKALRGHFASSFVSTRITSSTSVSRLAPTTLSPVSTSMRRGRRSVKVLPV